MKFISVFTGCGMFDLGLERAGMTCIGQVEIDARCQSLLRQHWPNVPKQTDIKEVKGAEFGPADVVVGGWPCQGNSVAGKRGGMADQRSGLFHEFVRVADESAASWLLGENVPGILSVSGGKDWSTVLEMLSGFRPEVPQKGWRNSGFCCGPKRAVAWRVLDAQYAGVPQRRRRVFIVGHLGDGTGPLKVLFEPESCSGNPAPRREAGTGVANQITRSPYADNEAQHGRLVARSLTSRNTRSDGDTENFVAAPITAGYAKGVGVNDGKKGSPQNLLVTHSLRSEGADASEDGTGRGTPLVTAYTIHGSDDCRRAASETDTAQCLRGRAPGTVENSSTTVAFQTRIGRNGRGQPSETVSALTSCEGGTHADSKPHIAGSMGVRRLTPLECERLMGLPNFWTAIGADGPLSDSARYRIIGNGGVVPELEWIGRRIVEFTAKQKQ